MQRADVGRGAADVDDNAVLDAGQKGGAAYEVGRVAREGEHGKAFRKCGAHQRAVILGQEEPAGNAAGVQSLAKGVDNHAGQVSEAGVHDARVLSLQKPDPADIARQRDVGARRRFSEDLACLALIFAIDRAEDRADGDCANSLPRDVLADLAKLVRVDRGNLASVELVSAMGEIGMGADRFLKVERPIDHWRQGLGRRQPEPDRRSRGQIAPLHDGVREVSGSQRPQVDRLGIDAGLLDHAG